MPSASPTASPCSAAAGSPPTARPKTVLTAPRLEAVYGVPVVVERLASGQTVCAPDYSIPSPRLRGEG